MARPSLFTLLALFLAPQLSSALQVSPNSPCSSLCRDSTDLDASDPNSSNTRNSDITCQDADYSSAAGTKFKNCMTCLQTSTFSQGSESDTMWFLYNLRYTAAYCVFGYPNATDVGSTPCTISAACGLLRASLEHGIPDPKGTTTYSYCSAGGGDAMVFSNFESCIACTSAMGTTEYLANYFAALEAGCRQQPAQGVLLGLNDTVFSNTPIGIVDPKTVTTDDSSKPGLAVPVIVGIAAGAAVVLLIVAGITFICLRRRKNKRARASAQANYYNNFHSRQRSSMSFQCQTHMASPRFWPAAEEGVSTPVAESPNVVQAQQNRSSIWKPHHPDDYAHRHQDDNNTTFTPISNNKKLATPLQITTTVSPAPPPQAYASPSSSSSKQYYSPSDFRSPLSADTVRSTSALLPQQQQQQQQHQYQQRSSFIRPYVPAEHGVHVQASPTATLPASSPVTGSTTTTGGTGMTPLLKSGGWPRAAPAAEMASPTTHTAAPPKKHIIKLGGSPPLPPPPPPPLKTSRASGGALLGRKSPRIGASGGGGGWGGNAVSSSSSGSPVESREIRTAFAAPPKR